MIVHPESGKVLYDPTCDGALPSSPVACILRVVHRQHSLQWEKGAVRVVHADGAIVRDGKEMLVFF